MMVSTRSRRRTFPLPERQVIWPRLVPSPGNRADAQIRSDTRKPLADPENYARMFINPMDNAQNMSPE